MKLSDKEQNLLDKYLWFYMELKEEKRPATTKAQKHFLDVIKGRAKAETPHEIAFIKFLKLQVIENKEKLKNKTDNLTLPGEYAYPDEKWDKMKDSTWGKAYRSVKDLWDE